jgi:predicted nucleic acid-binding protein
MLVDTGPLYALTDPSDRYHQRSIKELTLIQEANRFLAVTYPTLAEAYNLVVRRLGVKYAHEWLKELMEGSMLINPEAEDYLDAADRIGAIRDKPIAMFDAVVAAVGIRLGLEVWTYDRHFGLLRVKLWTGAR